MAQPFIPPAYTPPREVRFEAFHLEVLAARHATPDFDAVRASEAQIAHAFGPSNWWSAETTYASNLADLTRHEEEFERRESFAYAMLGTPGDAYLGCVYILPIRAAWQRDQAFGDPQARVYFWLSALQQVLDEEHAFETLRAWLAQAWPFAACMFPGCSIPWADWQARAPEDTRPDL